MDDKNPPEEKVVKVGLAAEVNVVPSLGLKVTRYYANKQLAAAAFFTRQTYNLEKKHKGSDWENHPEEHRHFVWGSVMLSSAAVDATIAEIIFQRADKIKDRRIFGEQKKILWFKRKKKFFRFDEQIQLLMKDQTGAIYDKNSQIWENVNVLRSLRNALVHARPTTASGSGHDPLQADDRRIAKLERKLKNRVPSNPFCDPGQDFVITFQSHGCAEWAVKSALDFILDYCSLIGFKPRGFDNLKVFDTR